jgi:hypothetical protein
VGNKSLSVLKQQAEWVLLQDEHFRPAQPSELERMYIFVQDTHCGLIPPYQTIAIMVSGQPVLLLELAPSPPILPGNEDECHQSKHNLA